MSESTNRMVARTDLNLPDEVRATLDWLLANIEDDLRHWPDGSAAHRALRHVADRIANPSTVNLHDLRGRLK